MDKITSVSDSILLTIMSNIMLINNIIIMVVWLFLLVFDLYAVVGRKIIRFNIVFIVNLIAMFIFIGMAMMLYIR